jgi:hypothetical protein
LQTALRAGAQSYDDSEFDCSFGAADRLTFTVIGTRGSVTLDPAHEDAQAIKARM